MATKKSFDSLIEWKRTYIPTSFTVQTLEEKFAGNPKGLGEALAMQSISKAMKGANHEHKTT